MKLNLLGKKKTPNKVVSEDFIGKGEAFCCPVLPVRGGFPGGSDGKESTYSAGDLDLIPRLERSPVEGNSYPLQYSCLGNPMDRGG